MFSDQFFSRLSSDGRVAVYEVVRAARQELDQTNDSSNWRGERRYVAQLKGFFDAYQLDWDVAKAKVPSRDDEFVDYFNWFEAQLDYHCARLRFASVLEGASDSDDDFEINADYRTEIHSHLLKVRKVVQNVSLEERQRENILKKLNELSSEVDKSRSGLSRFTNAFIEMTAAVGEGAEALEPAVKIMEKVAAIFGKAKKESDVEKQLETKETKLLIGPDEKSGSSAEE